jgi:hypothetical protein
MVVHRHDLPNTLARILRMLSKSPAKELEVLALTDGTDETSSTPEAEIAEPVMTDEAEAQDTSDAVEAAKA